MNLQYRVGRSWSKSRLTNTVLPAEMSSLQVTLSDLTSCLGDTLNSHDGGYKKRSPRGLGRILEDSICNGSSQDELWSIQHYNTLCGELDTAHPTPCLMHWYEMSMCLCDKVNSSYAKGSSLLMSLSNYSNRNTTINSTIVYYLLSTLTCEWQRWSHRTLLEGCWATRSTRHAQ